MRDLPKVERTTLENKKKLNTEEFILAIRKTLEGLM